MRTVRTKVYKFSELSKAAKATALEKFRDINLDHDWWECTYEDAANVGIKINGFDLGRGRDIKIDFDWSAEDTAKSIMEEHGETCDTYKVAAAFIRATNVKKIAIALVGDDDDNVEVWDGECEELADEFKEDIAKAYWKMLQDEYDYRWSDEAVIETIESNDYEFTKDGTQF